MTAVAVATPRPANFAIPRTPELACRLLSQVPMAIDLDQLALVRGAADQQYPNDHTRMGRMYSGAPVEKLRCWDSIYDKDYLFCVRDSLADQPGGRGNASYVPRAWQDQQTK